MTYPHYPNVNIDEIHKYDGQFNHDEQYSLLCEDISGRLIKSSSISYGSNSERINFDYKLGITKDGISLDMMREITNKSIVVIEGDGYIVKEANIISGFSEPAKINLYLQDDDSVDISEI